MSNEFPLDKIVRTAIAEVPTVSDARVERLIGSVFARIDRAAACPTRGRFLSAATAWLQRTGFALGWRWPASLSLARYAVPVAIAVVLGGLVGASLPLQDEAGQKAPLISLIAAATPLQPLGF